MKRILYFVLALLCTGLSYAENKHFDTMVVFGDSLSDNGNLYNFLWHTIPASPPYYLGHFSNGILWTEQLYNSYFSSGHTEGFQNYAVGGAGAVLAYKQELPFTLTMELNNYLYWHTYGKKETTLYTIWVGANNYLNGPTNVESITDSVVNAINGVVERLIQKGGTKFFIPNLPDLAKTSFVTENGNSTLINQLVQTHNSKLARKIAELKAKHPDVTLVFFDVYSFFNNALEHPRDYGFSYVKEPCYLGGYLGWLSKYHPSDECLHSYLKQINPHVNNKTWDLIKNNPQLKEAAVASYIYQLLPKKNKQEALNCEEYVFWDKIHPTTRAHYYIANEARRLLDEAGLIALPQ